MIQNQWFGILDAKEVKANGKLVWITKLMMERLFLKNNIANITNFQKFGQPSLKAFNIAITFSAGISGVSACVGAAIYPPPTRITPIILFVSL